MNRLTQAFAVSLLAPILYAQQPLDASTQQLAHDIFKQLIEINTSDSVGSTTLAAEAMRQRLLAAGFPAADLQVLGPNDRKGNLVARYRGKSSSTLKPILIIGHMDVVEARREDWTTDPFQFVEKDGYFYGRGTQDMKESDAVVVTDFIRLKREGFVPNRDIILALTADEEGGQSNGVDWLLKNHRDLIDADFVLNPDAGSVELDHGKPVAFTFEPRKRSTPTSRSPPSTPAATAHCPSPTTPSTTSPTLSPSSNAPRSPLSLTPSPAPISSRWPPLLPPPRPPTFAASSPTRMTSAPRLGSPPTQATTPLSAQLVSPRC